MTRAAAVVAVLLLVAGPAAARPRDDSAAYNKGRQDGLLSGNRANALSRAAAEGRLADVKLLLAKGADVNGHDENGYSALAQACAGGYPDIAEALIAAGAHFDRPENDKQAAMPLMIALFNGHPDVARVLIKHGAQLNAKANGGVSALARAVSSGRLEMVSSALNLGADPNETDASGQTPVHYATFANRTDMVNAILAAGGTRIGVQGRVGLALAADAKGALIAQAVLPRSPAETAGLRKGDRIVSIDGASAESLTVAQAVMKLRGAPDTTVEVGAVRGDAEPVVYKIVRQGVGVPTPTTDAVSAPAPAERTPSVAAASSADSDVDSPTEKAAPRPHDFALIVGIEEYQSLPKADYGVHDARAVRRHLAALGVPERNIVSLEGSAATKSKLQSYLQEWLPRNVKSDSTLFVYYSGHGAPDTANGNAYLVPWDGDPMFLKSTAYPLKQLYADLAKLKTKRVVVALDACFSGAGGRSVLAKGARPLVVKVNDGAPATPGLTVLAAASGGEITGSLDEQGHGAFTYFFLKGLSGAAKNADGAVTPRSLYDYLKPRVQDEARRQNREQTPTLVGGTDDAL